MEENFLRMVQLAEEFFETKNDPEQLSVDESVIEQLLAIHPSTVGERRNEKGPIAWMIVIPTTEEVMNKFLKGEMNERELVDSTNRNDVFEAIYLCSALVLPEFRRKGLAKELACEAIREINKEYSIKTLYYWGFSEGGQKLAEIIAKELGLKLLHKN